jgi:hypothetical protein
MQDELMNRKANRIAIYYLNMHKRYDLDVSLTLKINDKELLIIPTDFSHGLDQSFLLPFHGSHRSS